MSNLTHFVNCKTDPWQLLRQLFIFRMVQYYIILSEYCTQKYIITTIQLHINVLIVGLSGQMEYFRNKTKIILIFIYQYITSQLKYTAC